MARRGPRILGGRCKGRVLGVAGSARPTEGTVRKSLFDIWSQRVPGSRFVDLFAGSGAVGLEAASRGADLVVLVERDPRSLRRIQRNAEELGLADGPTEIRTLRLDLPPAKEAWTSRGGPPRADLVFADPPYSFAAYDALLAFAAGLLDDGDEIAIEHATRVDSGGWTAGLDGITRTDCRTYGDSALSFFRRVGS